MGLLLSRGWEFMSHIRRARLVIRGVMFIGKYGRNGIPAYLNEAIDSFQKALALCPPGHPGRPASLDNLADAIQTRYNRYGNLADLTSAIQYHEEALDLCPLGHPERFFSLNNLAVAILIRYKQEGNLADLTRAIQYHREALDLCPSEHPGRPACLNSLADAIQAQYNRDGNLDDLTRTIQYHEEALALRPPGHPDRFFSLNNLAVAIHIRYKREGDSADLVRVIRCLEEGRDLCPPRNPIQPILLDNLANAIQTRYKREGNLVDLTCAVQYHQEALDLRPAGHPGRSASLNNLAETMQTRYQQDGNLDDLTRAIQYHEEALDLRPPGNPDRYFSLNNLASAIQARYDREGNLADLTQAIQYHEQALDLRPPGNPDRFSCLNNLASAVKTRYNREGNLGDLTHAIEYHEEALGLCPSGHPDRPISLNNLAEVIQTRYIREGNLDDLNRTIQYHEVALGLRPPGHPDRCFSLNNLAHAMQTRYKREGNLADLTHAIQYHLEALDLRSPGNPNRFLSLINLADAMKTRYKRVGNLDDLTRAIQYHEEALGLCPPGHPDRPISLNNLADAIETRYNRDGNLTDLTRAIEYLRESLDLCPPGHPRRSDCLRYLAEALHAQYSRTESVGHSVNSASLDLSADTYEPVDHSPSRSALRDSSRLKIISLLREASQSPSCSPIDCLEAALVWVKISKDVAPESTLEAYTSALDQLDILLALGQSLSQHHNRLRSDTIFAKTKDLGVEAANWALRCGDLQRAVKLLEQGRGLLLAQIGRYRIELGDLRLANFELADRFARLSQLLDASIVSDQKLDEASSTVNDPYERYRKVATQWTQTVEEIRSLQDFETFLKPTPYEELRQSAAEGPVIMLIPNGEGCAALVVSNDAPIRHIDLPHATSNRLSELSNNFAHALTSEDFNDIQRERQCVDNLASLWNDVVGPISQLLQNDLGIPLRSRIWWCPASVACFLPLHAAGLYSKATSGENLPDRYISSYTPTLRALLRARRTSATAPKKLLVIPQPNTPTEPPLIHAQDEADKIEEIMSSTGAGPPLRMTMLSSEAGTREAVQREMESHPWIHFICHGVQVVNQPLDSYLSLYDGHLTLHKIIEQNLPNADFAFLAACHSAAGDTILANESLHLAAAMQFAGFRGVVGTLWTMCDADGPLLAEAFYRDMVKHGDYRRASVALNKAIKHLRRNKVPIHRWIRFVHIGA